MVSLFELHVVEEDCGERGLRVWGFFLVVVVVVVVVGGVVDGWTDSHHSLWRLTPMIASICYCIHLIKGN